MNKSITYKENNYNYPPLFKNCYIINIIINIIINKARMWIINKYMYYNLFHPRGTFYLRNLAHEDSPWMKQVVVISF